MTDNPNKETEMNLMQFAGYLTQAWAEIMACFVGASADQSADIRNKMLLSIRDAELAKIDAIERQLGISPTTAEIRRWFKQEKRGK